MYIYFIFPFLIISLIIFKWRKPLKSKNPRNYLYSQLNSNFVSHSQPSNGASILLLGKKKVLFLSIRVMGLPKIIETGRCLFVRVLVFEVDNV